MKDGIEFKTLIVITPKDCKRLLSLYPRIVENIKYGKLLFVGSGEVGDIVLSDPGIGQDCAFANENDIIPFDEVHKCIAKRMETILAGRELPRGITGWYYQQFLKMQYAYICEDEYYMVWDGDTIPCKEVNMFQAESGKPYLDMKHEYHKEYFDTMAVLLPGFGKVIERSFISEHMLFRADFMRGLIDDIEKNSDIPGEKFWEKIINAIPPEKIQDSSFSEFETYGTYVALKHMNDYILREWHSFRQGGNFFSMDTICDRDFNWLSRDFDAISFEKGHEVREDNANLFDNPYYQEKLSPKQMLQAAQMEYKEGYKEVWADDEAFEKANSGAEGMSDDVMPESPLKYLDDDAYRIYEKLGDEYSKKNVDQAFLCYENAQFLCPDPTEKERLGSKKDQIQALGAVKVNKTAFIILSYNNTYCLQRCIESIYTNCNPESYLLVIFDNGSTDGTRQWLSDWGNLHDEALIILNDDNLGFSAGNNAACEYLPEGFDVFYLNNDTRMPANALFWMRMALYEAPDTGAVGAVQNYAITDQLEDVNFSAPEQYVEYGASHNVPLDNTYEEKPKICGFAMMLKREVYDKVGGFDERFSPGYLEDDDISLRIRREGYKLLLPHNAFIYHAGSQSFKKNDKVNMLFEEHRVLIKRIWNFDPTIAAVMSLNEFAYANSFAQKGYTGDSEFTLLHRGCGCGNMLGYLHFLYPKARLYGIETDDNARNFAISCVHICKDESELPMRADEFDFVAENLG